jgi:hypothetical protein
MSMTRNEFEKQLKRQATVIGRALTYYSAWEAVWPTKETIKALTRFRDFFSPVRGALFEVLLLQVSKVWDGDGDGATISLPELLDAAREDMDSLVPHATPREMDDMRDMLERQKMVLEFLQKMKDEHLANLDARPFDDETVRKAEVDNLVKTVQMVFNKLCVAHEGASHTWSIQAAKSSWVTTEMLRVLDEAAGRRRGGEEDADA